MHFVAVPQTDVDLDASNITGELDAESAKYSWQAIESAEDPKTNRFINLVCERLGRRTPYCFEGDKSELNTDVLRTVLKKRYLKFHLIRQILMVLLTPLCLANISMWNTKRFLVT